MEKCFHAVVIYLVAAVCIFALQPALAEGPYTLTIYVEEGPKGLMGLFSTGHVFMGISDGVHTEKWGWYTQGKTLKQQVPGLVACAGGKLKPDDRHSYHVSKTYPISRHGYYVVKSRVIGRTAGGEGGIAHWNPFNHCGDFVQDVANAAGLDIQLPWEGTGKNRPNKFAAYLLAHGGIDHRKPPAGFLVSVKFVWIPTNDGKLVQNYEYRPAGEWVVTPQVPIKDNNWQLEWNGRKVWCYVDKSYGPLYGAAQLCETLKKANATGLHVLYKCQ